MKFEIRDTAIDAEVIKVWITRYVLIDGLVHTDVETCPHRPGIVRVFVDGFPVFLQPKDYAMDRTEALTKAAVIFDRKRAILRRKIDALTRQQESL